MGFNTTIVVLNDALEHIARTPDFGKRLRDAILMQYATDEPLDIPVQGYANPATVIEQHHADTTSVVAVGGNCATILGTTSGWRHGDQKDQIRILKDLADKLGYRISKKPTIKRK